LSALKKPNAKSGKKKMIFKWNPNFGKKVTRKPICEAGYVKVIMSDRESKKYIYVYMYMCSYVPR